MTAHMNDQTEQHLLQLSAEVSRIAGTLARLSAERAADEQKYPAAAELPELSPKMVASVLHARRLRGRYFSEDLFADPAWDMMLELLHSELVHARVSVSSLCIAAAVPATTALRWISSMVEQGLLVRRADPHDGRRIFVELAPEAGLALRRYFADLNGSTTI